MFLHVIFHDNDFAGPLTEALKELWDYVVENNGGSTKHRSVPEIFMLLDDKELLKSLVINLWTLRTMARHVEWETRGLHWENAHIKLPEWVGPDKNPLKIEDTYTEYFSVAGVEIVKNTYDGDNNGEHGWLDLNTGYAFNT